MLSFQHIPASELLNRRVEAAEVLLAARAFRAPSASTLLRSGKCAKTEIAIITRAALVINTACLQHGLVTACCFADILRWCLGGRTCKNINSNKFKCLRRPLHRFHVRLTPKLQYRVRSSLKPKLAHGFSKKQIKQFSIQCLPISSS